VASPVPGRREVAALLGIVEGSTLSRTTPIPNVRCEVLPKGLFVNYGCGPERCRLRSARNMLL
jgi:hypothetical protein